MNQLTNVTHKTPAHRDPTDDRFEEEARDLTRALPASRKVYIQGSRPDIQVPMREITLTDTPVGSFGKPLVKSISTLGSVYTPEVSYT